MYDRKFFAHNKKRRISLGFLPVSRIRVLNTKGVYLNTDNIRVEGIYAEELEEDSKELLYRAPSEIVYF